MTRSDAPSSGSVAALDFARLFATHRVAFRLEGRPDYSDPREQASLLHYRDTGAPLPLPGPWLDLVRTATGSGVTIRRLRLVSAPLSFYEAWELRVIAANVEAGEQIRVLPRRRRPYQRDVWVFDQAAYWLRYDDRGVFRGADVGPVDAECGFWMRRFDEATDTPADHLAAAEATPPARAGLPGAPPERPGGTRPSRIAS